MATILLVEDDRDIRVLLHTALHFDGHTVAEAKDARIGCDLALLLEPDVIITDYRLGRDSTGIDLLRYVRQQGLTCPVILFTADGQVRDLAFAAGASHYFVKGRDSLAQLRAAVDEVTLKPPIQVVRDA